MGIKDNLKESGMKLKLSNKMLILMMVVLINLGLFTLIPILSETEKKPMQDYEPATVVSLEKPEMQETEQRKKKRPEPKEEPKELPEKDVAKQQKKMSKQPQMKMDMPNFELNVDINQGMAVANPGKGSGLAGQQDAFQLGEVDKKPRVVQRVPPVYPYEARKRKISGKVVMRFLVTKKGNVRKVQVVRAKPEGIFENKAKEAIKKWKFEPGSYKGEPVPTWVELPISFDM